MPSVVYYVELAGNTGDVQQKGSFLQKCVKVEKINQITAAICALLNSEGGTLEISWDENIKTSIRVIEQKVIDMIGIAAVVKFFSFVVLEHNKLVIHVGKFEQRLVTLNYNFYLPTESQVNVVPPTTSLDEVRELINRRDKRSVGTPQKLCSHFSKNQRCSLKEGNNVELKQLKNQPSKCITLADRIVGKSNKLSWYVSAFANHRGGSIYFGISDDGTVEGQKVNEKDQHEVTKKVEKAIKKMIWQIGEPQRGKHWDISFDPVYDSDDNPIQSTFVIVIVIAACPGGVFTETPESYYIDDNGNISKMSFEMWYTRATCSLVITVPMAVRRLEWSSPKNRDIFLRLTPQLVQFRNNQNMRPFNRLASLAKEKFPGSNVRLIILTEMVTVAWKGLVWDQVERLLNEYEEELRKSPDSSIFQVRMLYLKSRIKRIQGKYEESYQTTRQGLQLMIENPVELHTTFYYMEACLITLLVAQEKSFDEQKKCATYYLDTALSHSSWLKAAGYPAEEVLDFQHKLHVYSALTCLGCCITGDIISTAVPSVDDIELAAKHLAALEENCLKGTIMSCFRQVEYNFAKCDLLRRRSQLLQNYDEQRSTMKRAFELASETRDLSRKHGFLTMVHYAEKRRGDLTEKLVLTALRPSGRQPTNRTFLGFSY